MARAKRVLPVHVQESVSPPIRLLLFGAGSIGLKTLKLALSRPDFQVVGVVDSDSKKTGKDVGSLLQTKPLRLKVYASVEQALRRKKADVAIHTTASHLEMVAPQLETLLKHGLNIVSSCEELFYPWLTHLDDALRLGELAMRNRVSVIAAGVNPGLVMDRLPTFLAQACPKVKRIHVQRIVDLSTRREPLQRKAGLGLTLREFETGMRYGWVGHVGLPESVAFLAQACQLPVERIEETIEPIADKRGIVRGFRQVAFGYAGRRWRIALELEMSLHPKAPRDEIHIEGNLPLKVVIDGGVPGDDATAALLLSMAKQALKAPPGFYGAFGWLFFPFTEPLLHWGGR